MSFARQNLIKNVNEHIVISHQSKIYAKIVDFLYVSLLNSNPTCSNLSLHFHIMDTNIEAHRARALFLNERLQKQIINSKFVFDISQQSIYIIRFNILR